MAYSTTYKLHVKVEHTKYPISRKVVNTSVGDAVAAGWNSPQFDRNRFHLGSFSESTIGDFLTALQISLVFRARS